MDYKDLRINGKRLQNSLEEMAKIGATPGGGVQRLTLSDEDKQARDLFVKWLKELNLKITVDEMGNIFGKRAGKNTDLVIPRLRKRGTPLPGTDPLGRCCYLLNRVGQALA